MSDTSGFNDGVHKRPLLTPEEVGKLLVPVSDPSHPDYPGLMILLANDEKHPILARRINYFKAPILEGFFDPHPDPRHKRPLTLKERQSNVVYLKPPSKEELAETEENETDAAESEGPEGFGFYFVCSVVRFIVVSFLIFHAFSGLFADTLIAAQIAVSIFIFWKSAASEAMPVAVVFEVLLTFFLPFICLSLWAALALHAVLLVLALGILVAYCAIELELDADKRARSKQPMP